MNFIGAGLAIIGAAIGAGYGNGQVIAKNDRINGTST